MASSLEAWWRRHWWPGGIVIGSPVASSLSTDQGCAGLEGAPRTRTRRHRCGAAPAALNALHLLMRVALHLMHTARSLVASSLEADPVGAPWCIALDAPAG